MRIKLSILNFVRVKIRVFFRKEHSAEIALYETARKFLEGEIRQYKTPFYEIAERKERRIVKTEKVSPRAVSILSRLSKRIEYGSF